MKKKYYNAFGDFVFRTPLFFFQLKDKILELVDQDYFTEGLYLASPELKNEKGKSENTYAMQKALYKYFSRSFSRCTPFGLFAGCSVGKFGNSTNVKLKPLMQYTRFTRLDMNYICTLIQHIEQDPQIKNKLRYFPNDSIYELAGKIRYVEYYYEGTKRIHTLVSIENNEYITSILDKSQTGATISELASVIVKDEITIDEAKNFVDDLISFQILKSELDPLVTGGDPLMVLINQLDKISDTKYLPILVDIYNLLRKIDNSNIGKSLGCYDEVVKLIERIGVCFEIKYLFQTDLFKPIENASLSWDFVKEINELIVFLSAVTDRYKNEQLNRFRNEFYSRYEDQELPLLQVLDCELGLGYPIKETGTGDVNALIDDLILPKSKETHIEFRNSRIKDILLKKCIKALADGRNVVTIEDTDIQLNLDMQRDDLPDTISLMCTIVKDIKVKDYKIVLKLIGGVCSANLMGRFCHLNPQINNLVKQITEKEQELHEDVILAEITHLPESRVGNIILRPPLRKYEIRYLSNSCFELDKQIPVSDILVSVRENRIILRSKS